MLTEQITSGAQTDLFGSSGDVLGKDDFLKILVTQLRHQDPLNPMRSEEFAAQLAQFSSLEQLYNINNNLLNGIDTDLLLNQSINNIMATTLIGKSATAVGNTLSVQDGKDVKLHYKLSGYAQKITINIYDGNGKKIRTIEQNAQGAGIRSLTWDGKNDEGKHVKDGDDYTFTVDAQDADDNKIDVQMLIIGTITAVRYENGSVILTIGDQEVSMADVFQVGEQTLSDEEGSERRARKINITKTQ